MPYMSICLLYAAAAIDRANGGESAVIEHTASDDLESLFYIFIDFVTTFDGPMGKQMDSKMERWGQAIEDMGASAAPYKSGLVLVLRCDMELMNRTTTYFGALKGLVQAWRHKFLDADADQKRGGVTHEEIEEVLNAWISHEGADEPLPPEEFPSPLLSDSVPECERLQIVPMTRS